jgi:hypothetical protein
MSAARHVAAWVVTSVALAGVWLVVTDSPKLPELLTGAVVVAIAATASELVRAQRDNPLRPPARGLLRAWRPILRAPRDLLLVVGAIARQVFERRPQRGRVDGAVELDSFVAERCNRAQRAFEVALELAAHGVQLESDPRPHAG